jgi:hypothetical protein
MEEATPAHPPLEMETASRRQSATTRVWGSIGSAEIFAEGAAYTTTKWDVHVHHTGLARYRQGAMCTPARHVARNGAIPLQRELIYDKQQPTIPHSQLPIVSHTSCTHRAPQNRVHIPLLRVL